MPGPQQIRRWAEEAIEKEALRIRPDLADRWRDVKPADIGLNDRDWLEASKEMMIGFNSLAVGVPPVSLSRESRRKYRVQDLINFARAIADVAEQVR